MSEAVSAGTTESSASSPPTFGTKGKSRTSTATTDSGLKIVAGMDPKQKAEMMRLRLDIWREERTRRDVQKTLRASEAAKRSKGGELEGGSQSGSAVDEGKTDSPGTFSLPYSAQASPSPTSRVVSPRSAPSRLNPSKVRDSISLTQWMSDRKELDEESLQEKKKRRDEASEEERAREDSFVVSSSDGASNTTERTRTVTTPSGDETITVETTTTTPTGKKTTLRTTSRSTTAGGGVRTTEKISTTEEDSKTTLEPLSPSDHKSPKTSSSHRTTATIREEKSSFSDPSNKMNSFADVVSAAMAANRSEKQRDPPTSNGHDTASWGDQPEDRKEGTDVFVFGENSQTLPRAPPPPLVRPLDVPQPLDDPEDDVMVIPPLAEEEDDDDLGTLEPTAYHSNRSQSTTSKNGSTTPFSASNPPQTAASDHSSARPPISPRVNFANRVDEIIFFDSLEHEDDADGKKTAANKGKKTPVGVEPLVDTTPPPTSTHSAESQRPPSAAAPPATTPAATTSSFWSRTSEPIMTPPFSVYPSPRSADEPDPGHATNMFNVAEYLRQHGTKSNSSSEPDPKPKISRADGGVTSPPSIEDINASDVVFGRMFGNLQQDIDHLISQVTSIGRQELERAAPPQSQGTARPESRLTLSRDDDVADLQVSTMAQKFGTSLSLLGDKTDVIIDCLERLHLRCTSLEEENAMLREALRTELVSRSRRPAPTTRLLTDSASSRRWNRQAARTPPSLRAADVRIASTDLFKSDPSIPESTTTLATRSTGGRKFVSELSEFMPLDGHDSTLAEIMDRQRGGEVFASLDNKPHSSEESKTTTRTTTTVTRRSTEERKTNDRD